MLQATESDEPTEINRNCGNSEDDNDDALAPTNCASELIVDDEPTGKKKLAKFGCCGVTLATIVGGLLLYCANGFTFLLLVWVGGALRLFDEHFGGTNEFDDDEKKTLFQSEEHRELVLFVLAVMVQAMVNLVTIYFFFCKRTDESKRLLTAGVAVFGCCQRRRVPNEAVVPCTEILAKIGQSSCTAFWEMLSVFSKFCILPLAILGFVFCGIFGGSWTIFLVALPPVLWLVVWMLSRRPGGLFDETEYLESIRENNTVSLETKRGACDKLVREERNAIELAIQLV